MSGRMNVNMIALANFIVGRRNALGLMQQDLFECIAAKTDMASRTNLSDLETGNRRFLPEPEVLEALADCLRTSTQELLTAAGYLPKASDAAPRVATSRDVLVTTADAVDLDERAKRIIADVIYQATRSAPAGSEA